jgi:hypothetical protein
MLKRIFFIFCLQIASMGAFSQMQFGVKVGANFANVSHSSLTTSQFTSYHFGVFERIPLSKKWDTQIDFLCSHKGYNYSSSKVSGEITLNYVEVPFKLLYKINDNFSIGGGPYLGYALSGNRTASDGTGKFIAFNRGDYNRVDFGLNGTVSARLYKAIELSAFYNYGFSNLHKINDLQTGLFANNRVFGVSVSMGLYQQ